MSSIVILLREVIDESGIGLRGLAEKIRAEQPQGPLPRGYQTLSKRLRGIGLQNDPHLIHAIIAICTQGERQLDVTSHVTELLADARGAAVIPKTAPRKQPAATDRQLLDALTENNTLRKKMERLRIRAERAEKKLAKAQELLAASDPQTRRRPPLRQLAAGESAPLSSRPWKQSAAAAAAPSTEPVTHAAAGSQRGKDSPNLEEVISFLREVPGLQQRTASSLRAAFDSVLDGERTGRYDLATLGKAEKTYLGSRVEHYLWEAWGLTKNSANNRLREVPLRFTWTSTWMLGPEHVGRVCLLMRANESDSRWSLGVLDAKPEHLNRLNGNRDGKTTLSAAGRAAIRWLVEDASLPENALLHLDQATLTQVFSPASDAAATHAQGRTDNLFRVVQGRLIDRAAVSTVAMTSDIPRRVRQAHHNLRSEGVLVLGPHMSHLQVAAALRLPQPDNGQWVSTRVTRRRPGDGDAPFAQINGEQWRVATPDDPVETAPLLR
ncbi:NaeI family type II restriction endonuclease [Streptomyces sp. NPDC002992]|uniref:NaeI family type II restriction endonuclease n=1 Tax=Streptomyces sp. NPDC002992 TaxID=3154273 RepID=UPI0033B3E1ED